MSYTFDRNEVAEACIHAHQQIIVRNVLASIGEEHLAAIVLIGGYGRGEGGYTLTEEGRAAPFNDYDYFLIFRGVSLSQAQRLTSQIPCLDPLVGIEVDFHPLRVEQLPQLECSLMFAEMLAGHKVIYGEKDILAQMTHMPLDQLPLGEFTRLMTNRGCLLLLNYTAPNPNSFTLYINKAILAAGDAMLAMNCLYHTSYRIKTARLSALLGSDHPLCVGYDKAVQARFRPDLAQHANGKDLHCATELWLAIMRQLEEFRLQRPVANWSDYCTAGISKQQGTGSYAKHIVLNLGNNLLRRCHGIQWLLRHPRERIVSALPLLLTSRTRSNPAIEQALALQANTTWHQAANRLLELWGRYS